MARNPKEELQSPFAVDRLTKGIRHVEGLISDIQAGWAHALEITVPQWNILVTIADAEEGGQYNGEIARS